MAVAVTMTAAAAAVTAAVAAAVSAGAAERQWHRQRQQWQLCGRCDMQCGGSGDEVTGATRRGAW